MSDDGRMQWLRDRASLADQLVLDMRTCGELLTAAGVPEYPSAGGGVYTLEHRIAMLAKGQDKAVAAELRRLAERDNLPRSVTEYEHDPSCGDLREAVQEWLRKRADELDTPKAE